MQVLPINNIQNNKQQSFKAKFRQRDIKEFLTEIQGGDVDIIPKLYTMLEYIKYQKGKKAEIEHIGLWHKILVDGKSICENNKYFSAFHALFDATVKTKTSLIKESPIQRYTEEEFESEYYKNSKKTKEDIENLFKD